MTKRPEDNLGDKIKSIAENSGNDFHFRVVELLRSNGWSTKTSPYYPDSFSEKPREIDIVAEKLCSGQTTSGKHCGWLPVRLFVECKYINTPTIFWFDKKDLNSAESRVSIDTSLESSRINVGVIEHSYLRNVSVAKLFATENKSPDGEPMYKALTQSLNALTYFREIPAQVTKRTGLRDAFFRTINYPVIVCSDFKFFYRRDGLANISDNFQLEVNYAYFDRNKSPKNEYFLIDVVSFDSAVVFLKQLEDGDVSLIAKEYAKDAYNAAAEEELHRMQRRINPGL